MATYEDEEATTEEKLDIINHYLSQSPPGQFYEVLKDLKKITTPDVLTDVVVKDTIRNYHLQNYCPVSVSDDPEEAKVLICKEAEVDADHYVDVHRNQIVGFNHLEETLDMQDIQPLSDLHPEFEQEKQALLSHLRKYMHQSYSNQGGVGVYLSSENQNFVIVMCAERINLRNFWSGRWKSRWELVLGSPGNLEGQVTLCMHYYENGNLQLHSTKKIKQRIEYHDALTLAEGVTQAIRDAENLIETSLGEMYANMSQDTFKEMRRAMPITRMKMDWSIHTHRNARNFRK